MRGQLGTSLEAHTTGDTYHFFPDFSLSQQIHGAAAVPEDQALKIRITAYARNASGTAVTIDGPDSGGFAGQSIEPLAPEFYEATRASLDWTISTRPRLHRYGSNSQTTLEADLQLREIDIDGHAVRITSSDGDEVTIETLFASGSQTSGAMEVTRCEWIPTDGTDSSTTGLLIVELTFSSNPATVDLQLVRNLVAGSPLTISQP
jgi:hypothetical protein